jgi:hypothetical protein
MAVAPINISMHGHDQRPFDEPAKERARLYGVLVFSEFGKRFFLWA